MLLVDLDPQANLTSGLGITPHIKSNSKKHSLKSKKTPSIYDVLIGKSKVSEAFLATEVENLFLILFCLFWNSPQLYSLV